MRWRGSFFRVVCTVVLFLAGVGLTSTGLAQTAPEAVGPGLHLVQKGDTYYGLSRLYQVPVDSLQRWNGADLKLGATIRVKPAASANLAAKEKPEPAHPVTNPAVNSSAVSLNNSSQKPTGIISAGNRVLIIPFDPALYFSDADNDISWQSKVPKQKVRYIFRARLNALLEAPGYQSINLLNNTLPDSTDELQRIYKSLTYSYQDVKSANFHPVTPPKEKGLKAWVKNTKGKVSLGAPAGPQGVAQDETKYYGVKVTDPQFYTAQSSRYGADYLLFINQFEIFTDYSNCLDRTTQNFLRNFRVHYTIMDAKGEVLAGNKILIPYESNVNDINKIGQENLGKMASRIMADLPRPETGNGIEASN